MPFGVDLQFRLPCYVKMKELTTNGAADNVFVVKGRVMTSLGAKRRSVGPNTIMAGSPLATERLAEVSTPNERPEMTFNPNNRCCIC